MVKKILACSVDGEGVEDTLGFCQDNLDEELNSKCQINSLALPSANNGLNKDAEELFLFDPKVISSIDMSKAKCKFAPGINSPSNPTDGFVVRPLSSKDYDRGFLDILGQLTSVGQITKEQFLEHFHEMRLCPNTYYITVIVDTQLDRIVGSGTMVHERKFIHQCGSRGLIEDIIVNNEYRGKQLGKILLAILVEIGKAVGCYKITLNCKDELVKFYNSFGLVKESGNANFMILRVDKEK